MISVKKIYLSCFFILLCSLFFIFIRSTSIKSSTLEDIVYEDAIKFYNNEKKILKKFFGVHVYNEFISIEKKFFENELESVLNIVNSRQPFYTRKRAIANVIYARGLAIKEIVRFAFENVTFNTGDQIEDKKILDDFIRTKDIRKVYPKKFMQILLTMPNMINVDYNKFDEDIGIFSIDNIHCVYDNNDDITSYMSTGSNILELTGIGTPVAVALDAASYIRTHTLTCYYWGDAQKYTGAFFL